MTRLPIKTPERLSLSGLQAEVSGLLERLWHRGLDTGPLDGQDYAPPLEVMEEPDRFVVTAEVPGVNASGIEVTACQNTVTISGEKVKLPSLRPPEAPETMPPTSLQSERRYGRFRRTVTLPGPIQVDDVKAALADGVLTVTVPKAGASIVPEVRVEVRQPEAAPEITVGGI